MKINLTLIVQLFNVMITFWFTKRYLLPLIEHLVSFEMNEMQALKSELNTAVKGISSLIETEKMQINNIKEKTLQEINLFLKKEPHILENKEIYIKTEADYTLIDSQQNNLPNLEKAADEAISVWQKSLTKRHHDI